MPGHKRKGKFFNKNLYEYDFTENFLTDNLLNPVGIIKKAEDKIAALTKADKSYICVNGGSGGVLASVLALSDENEYFLCERKSHISLYNAITLSGAVPVYIDNFEEDYFLELLKENPKARAVFVTSPSYEGNVLDIRKIARMCHSMNKALIVDETHGSHFYFSDYFPENAILCGADVVINSYHKTLPCLNQCAVINIKSDLVNPLDIKKTLSIIQTTSPSYVLMGSIDYVVNNLKKEHFDQYIIHLEDFRKKAKNLQNITLSDTDDKSKLYFKTKLTGDRFEKLMYDEGILIEYAHNGKALLISTVADEKEDFDKLYNALLNVDKFTEDFTDESFELFYGEFAFSPRYAYNLPDIEVSTEKAINKISASYIVPYPPGVPIVVPGEIIPKKILDLKNKNILGLDKIKVCKI